MLRKAAAGALIALVTAALGLAAGSPASAAQRTEDCRTGTYQIADRPDSGADGNWALDTFKRTIKVCHVPAEVAAKTVEVPSWTYSVEGVDEGTFVTQGTKTPEGATANPAWFPGRTGSFSGDWSLKVTAPSDWQYWVGGKETNTLSTGEWIAALWSAGAKPAEVFTDWAWKYDLCGEVWKNRSARRGGNFGNITGKFECAKPEVKLTVPTCENPKAALTVTNRNARWKIIVSFNDGKGQWVQPGKGVSYEFAEGQVQVKVNGKKLGEPWKYAAPRCETASPTTAPPTTAPPAPGTGGGDDEQLPKTGFSATDAALGGGGLVVIGVGVVLALWWHRRRTEVTYTA